MDALTISVLQYRYYIEVLAIVIASLTAISSVDDVFVDLYYWCLRATRRHQARQAALARRLQAGAALPERPFAIMVPAWRESDVIFSMVATNSRLLVYRNCHFFIGVYRNDQPTCDQVKRIQAFYANVHMVVVPRDGPTSKADCLNEVVAAILAHEIETGVGFAGIALHDAEDFIHPHELKVFNTLIGDLDFVQLPVFSFTQPIRDTIGGIYMDEFAEVHAKDLIVRDHLSGVIPCAGVSACFSHNAIVALARENDGEVFQTACFTEDYDIAFRLRALKLKAAFVSCRVNYTIDIDQETVSPVYVRRSLPVSTREFFPSELRGAYRQRARWLIGIVFQGTSTHGWRGNRGTRYFLFRDRKGILTAPIIILGYFALANLVLIGLYLATYAPDAQFDFVLLGAPYVVELFFVNIGFLLWRLLHRVIFTARIYDWRHGLMAVPRLVVANFVNFFASMRATHVYAAHLLTGKPLVWDKTSHSYPVKFRADPGPSDPAGHGPALDADAARDSGLVTR